MTGKSGGERTAAVGSLHLDASSGQLRLDSLTGLRFFAAWLVVQHHFTNFALIPGVQAYTGFGTTGVTFFFVLSGFVLTWSYRRDDTPGRFYWRRFARIWPLHALTTLLAIPVFYTWREVPYEWTGILLSFALLHAWSWDPIVYFAGNPASWSLSCELFFYALHPFVVRPFQRLGGGGLMVAAVAVLGAMYAAADLLLDVLPARVYGWMVYISPVFRVGEFLFGMLLAVAMRRGWRSPIGVIPAAMLVGAWFHLYYRIRPDLASGPQLVVAHLDYPALALAYGLVIAAAARLDVEGRASLLRSRVMVLLGQWSYALYLVHATIIYALIELIGVRSGVVWTNTWWLAFITIVSTAVSAGLYHVFEHPVEQWLRRIQKAWLTRRMLRARPVPGPA